jgi:AraC-like DNA-binding protein
MVTTAHASAHALLRHAVTRGVPAATVAGWLGVSERDLDRPGRLPAERVVDAWARLRGELADAAVAARAACQWTLADWGLFGFHVGSAPTLREALAAVVHGVRLITDRGSWRVVVQDGIVRCVWSWTASRALDHGLPNEVMVSAFVRGIRELGGGPPLAVHFTHRAPAARSEHATLLDCEVRFGQASTAVLLPRARLEVAPRGANARLHRFLGEQVDGELAALAPAALHERAARLLARRLRDDAQLPSVPEIARNLGVGERTLRRRLADEGTSVRTLRNAVQLDCAADLLASSDASMSEIALACGFADASAFGRAWRRSRNQPPSHSRAMAADSARSAQESRSGTIHSWRSIDD